MKVFVYSPCKTFKYFDILNDNLKFEVEFIDEIPEEMSFNDFLIISVVKIEKDLIEMVQYKKLEYLVVMEDYSDPLLPQLTNAGGSFLLRNDLESYDFLFYTSRIIMQSIFFKISHQFSRNEFEMFRYIGRATNGKKEELTKLIFGVTSESTFDVNLNRLRKKLKDPEIGKDFFRILLQKGCFYIVCEFDNYEIPRGSLA